MCYDKGWRLLHSVYVNINLSHMYLNLPWTSLPYIPPSIQTWLTQATHSSTNGPAHLNINCSLVFLISGLTWITYKHSGSRLEFAKHPRSSLTLPSVLFFWFIHFGFCLLTIDRFLPSSTPLPAVATLFWICPLNCLCVNSEPLIASKSVSLHTDPDIIP